MGELDDYLNGIDSGSDAETTPAEPTGETTPPPAPEPAPTPEPAPPAEPQQGASQQPRDERGRFAKAEEPPAAPHGAPAPVPPEPAPQTVPIAVMLEERRRRQEAEARVLQQQQPQITDDTFYASPVAAAQHMMGQQTQFLQQQIQNYRYELAEDFTRAQHDDYDGIRDAFIAKFEARDPWAIAVATQMGAMPNPAKFVYEQTKRQMTIGDDPQAYESRVRADERAKVLREMAQQQQVRPAAPPVPQSLNSEPSEAQSMTPLSFEPTPLTNILPHNY